MLSHSSYFTEFNNDVISVKIPNLETGNIIFTNLISLMQCLGTSANTVPLIIWGLLCKTLMCSWCVVIQRISKFSTRNSGTKKDKPPDIVCLNFPPLHKNSAECVSRKLQRMSPQTTGVGRAVRQDILQIGRDHIIIVVVVITEFFFSKMKDVGKSSGWLHRTSSSKHLLRNDWRNPGLYFLTIKYCSFFWI